MLNYNFKQIGNNITACRGKFICGIKDQLQIFIFTIVLGIFLITMWAVFILPYFLIQKDYFNESAIKKVFLENSINNIEENQNITDFGNNLIHDEKYMHNFPNKFFFKNSKLHFNYEWTIIIKILMPAFTYLSFLFSGYTLPVFFIS